MRKGANLLRPPCCTPAEAAARLASGAQVVVVGGCRRRRCRSRARHRRRGRRTHDLQPHARFLAMLAPDLTPLDPVKPLYLRAPDAKPQSQASLPRAPS